SWRRAHDQPSRPGGSDLLGRVVRAGLRDRVGEPRGARPVRRFLPAARAYSLGAAGRDLTRDYAPARLFPRYVRTSGATRPRTSAAFSVGSASGVTSTRNRSPFPSPFFTATGILSR